MRGVLMDLWTMLGVLRPAHVPNVRCWVCGLSCDSVRVEFPASSWLSRAITCCPRCGVISDAAEGSALRIIHGKGVARITIGGRVATSVGSLAVVGRYPSLPTLVRWDVTTAQHALVKLPEPDVVGTADVVACLMREDAVEVASCPLSP